MLGCVQQCLAGLSKNGPKNRFCGVQAVDLGGQICSSPEPCHATEPMVMFCLVFPSRTWLEGATDGLSIGVHLAVIVVFFAEEARRLNLEAQWSLPVQM